MYECMLLVIWCHYALQFAMLAGWWLTKKCCTKRCLELWNNTVGHMTFVNMANMSVRLITVSYTYANLSSFFMMHPDLVLVISPSCMVGIKVINWLVWLGLTIGCLVADSNCVYICAALHNLVCFLLSVCFAAPCLCLHWVNIYIKYF